MAQANRKNKKNGPVAKIKKAEKKVKGTGVLMSDKELKALLNGDTKATAKKKTPAKKKAATKKKAPTKKYK